MDLSRIKNPTDKDEGRLKKYRKAAKWISKVLPMQDEIKDAGLIRLERCVEIQPFISHEEFVELLSVLSNAGMVFGGGTKDVTDEKE